MKKNLRVNISGVIFNIDEDAYETLQNYLDRLRLHFGNSASTSEIISDIESRIAEMFQEKNGSGEGVIDKGMVVDIIKTMGEPTEIDGDEDIKQDHNTDEKSYSYTKKSTKRRLYRDSDNKVVGGVASGLSMYFNLDPIWIRLAFVALTISGMSILVYIILWIVIPEAKTTAQKLEMKGEAINLENIEKSILDEFDDISNRFKDIKNKHFTKKKDELTIFEKIAHVIVRIIHGFLKFIGLIIGIVFAFVALILIMVLIPTFFSTSLVWISSFPGIHFISLPSALNMITTSNSDINLFLTSLALVLFVPLIALVYQGIKLIFGIRHRQSLVGILLLSLWIIGLALLIFSGTKLSNSFDRKSEITQNLTLTPFSGDTLYVNLVNPTTEFNSVPLVNSHYGQFLFFSDENNYYLNPKVKSEELNEDEDFQIRLTQYSRGSTYVNAQQNAEKINYSYVQKDSLLELSAYCSWPIEQQFRGQHINIVLGIPKGKALKYITPQRNYNHNEVYFSDSLMNQKNINLIYIDDYQDQIIIKTKESKIEINDGDIDFE